MKHRERLHADYAALKRSVCFKMARIAAISLFAVFLVLALADHRLANVIVDALQRVFGLSFFDAQLLYVRIFRRNASYIIFATVAVTFIIFVRSLLSQLNRYFHEISRGLDVPAEEEDSELETNEAEQREDD